MGEQWTYIGNNFDLDGAVDSAWWWACMEDDPPRMADFIERATAQNAEVAAREGYRLGDVVSAGLVTMPGGDVPSVRVVWEAVRDGAEVD